MPAFGQADFKPCKKASLCEAEGPGPGCLSEAVVLLPFLNLVRGFVKSVLLRVCPFRFTPALGFSHEQGCDVQAVSLTLSQLVIK